MPVLVKTHRAMLALPRAVRGGSRPWRTMRLTSSAMYFNRTTNLPSITSFTILGWFKLTANIGGYNGIFSIGNNVGGGAFYFVGTNGDGTSGQVWNGSTNNTGAAYTIGTWYFLALVVDGTSTNNCRLYRNAVLDISCAGNASVTADNLYIGRDTTGDAADMSANNVMVYSAALSLTEISKQMYQVLPARRLNLNSWTPFANVNDFRDYSGNNNHWTMTGSPTWEPGVTGYAMQQRRARSRVRAPVSGAASQNLGGVLLAPDEILFGNTLSVGARGLAGVFSTTDDSIKLAAVAASLASTGSNSKTDEIVAAGSAGLGAVNLPGSNSKTDEAVFAAAIARGALGLLGIFAPSDEITNPGSMAIVTSLSGGAIATDESANPGTAGRGSVNIPGTFSAPDEKINPGALAAFIAMAGQASATDERTYAGALAAVLVIAGSYSVTDEALSIATVARGTVNLGGVLSLTDEKSGAGALSSGGQVLSGAFSTPDEKSNPGTLTPSPIALAGVYCKTDEQAYQAALAMLRALAGVGILTDEQTRQAAVALGSAPLGGQFSTTDERTAAGQMGMATKALSGAAVTTDERALAGTMAVVTSLLGTSIFTDEAVRTSVLTVGPVSLVSQFTQADERILLALIVSGVVVTRIIRRSGAYQLTARRVGTYQTKVRRIGPYDG